MQEKAGSTVQLSQAQARFASEHDARVGLTAHDDQRDVYLYCDEEWATYRWRVDADGAPVEVTAVRRSTSAL